MLAAGERVKTPDDRRGVMVKRHSNPSGWLAEVRLDGDDATSLHWERDLVVDAPAETEAPEASAAEPEAKPARQRRTRTPRADS